MRSNILALYQNPSASVRVNGVLSPVFQLSNGTRQGCPLSPLIFILALEPLMCSIRGNSSIEGISAAAGIYKVAAYADDLLFTLSNPAISLPSVYQELRNYSKVSNFKINFSKSEALGIGISPQLESRLKANFRFRWVRESIKYLGTQIPVDQRKIYACNFLPLLGSIQRDLERWGKGLLSWYGRCNVIKMSVLPRILYLFQTLPIKLPDSFFSRIQSLMIKFIWRGRRARIAIKTLYQSKDKGGLGLPDIKLYYQATHLARVVDWARHDRIKHWVRIERHGIEGNLLNEIWQKKPLSKSVRAHPTIGPTVSIVRKLIEKENLCKIPSPLLTIPWAVPMGRQDHLSGRTISILEFMRDGEWLPLHAIQERCQDHHMPFWRALQIRSFLNSLPLAEWFVRPLSPFETLCQGETCLNHTLSRCTQMLRKHREEGVSLDFDKWSQELQADFSPEQSRRATVMIHKASICGRKQELGFKIARRWYRTPDLLHNIYPQLSRNCWRCDSETGTLGHIFWGCAKIRPFWQQIQGVIGEVLNTTIELNPMLFLFHVTDQPIQRYMESPLRFFIDAGRALIPLHWKQSVTPSIQQWIHAVNEIMLMEYLVAGRKRQYNNNHERTWAAWRQFQKSRRYAELVAR